MSNCSTKGCNHSSTSRGPRGWHTHPIHARDDGVSLWWRKEGVSRGTGVLSSAVALARRLARHVRVCGHRRAQFLICRCRKLPKTVVLPTQSSHLARLRHIHLLCSHKGQGMDKQGPNRAAGSSEADQRCASVLLFLAYASVCVRVCVLRSAIRAVLSTLGPSDCFAIKSTHTLSLLPTLDTAHSAQNQPITCKMSRSMPRTET